MVAKAKPVLPNAAPATKPVTDKQVAAKNDDAQLSTTAKPDSDAKPVAVNAPAAPQPASAPAHTPDAGSLASVQPASPLPLAASNAAPVATAQHMAPQTPDTAPNLNGLAVEIAAKSLGGAKQFDIRLDPPELGRVEVRLSIDASGKAQAHMTADQLQTLHLLQKDSAILTRALREAGLDVASGSLNFSLKGQDRQAGDSAPRAATPSAHLRATKTIEAVQSGAVFASSAGNSRLDIHV